MLKTGGGRKRNWILAGGAIFLCRISRMYLFFNRAFTVIMALYSINRDRYLHEMEVEHRKDRLYRRKEKRKKRLHKHVLGFMQMKYGRKCSVHIRSDWTRI